MVSSHQSWLLHSKDSKSWVVCFTPCPAKFLALSSKLQGNNGKWKLNRTVCSCHRTPFYVLTLSLGLQTWRLVMVKWVLLTFTVHTCTLPFILLKTKTNQPNKNQKPETKNQKQQQQKLLLTLVTLCADLSNPKLNFVLYRTNNRTVLNESEQHMVLSRLWQLFPVVFRKGLLSTDACTHVELLSINLSLCLLC